MECVADGSVVTVANTKSRMNSKVERSKAAASSTGDIAKYALALALVPVATLLALLFIPTRYVARQVGLEPTTCGFGDRCSAS